METLARYYGLRGGRGRHLLGSGRLFEEIQYVSAKTWNLETEAEME